MRAVIALSLMMLVPLAAYADSMRCGKWVVNEESSPQEIAQKCGEPLNKEVTEQDVLGKNPAGYPIKLGIQVIERWYYKLSPGSLPMLVTIVDGKVKSIERAE